MNNKLEEGFELFQRAVRENLLDLDISAEECSMDQIRNKILDVCPYLYGHKIVGRKALIDFERKLNRFLLSEGFRLGDQKLSVSSQRKWNQDPNDVFSYNLCRVSFIHFNLLAADKETGPKVTSNFRIIEF